MEHKIYGIYPSCYCVIVYCETKVLSTLWIPQKVLKELPCSFWWSSGFFRGAPSSTFVSVTGLEMHKFHIVHKWRLCSSSRLRQETLNHTWCCVDSSLICLATGGRHSQTSVNAACDVFPHKITHWPFWGVGLRAVCLLITKCGDGSCWQKRGGGCEKDRLSK